MIASSMLGALDRYEQFGCGFKFYSRFTGEVPPPDYCNEIPTPPEAVAPPVEQSAPEPDPKYDRFGGELLPPEEQSPPEPEPEDEAKKPPDSTPE